MIVLEQAVREAVKSSLNRKVAGIYEILAEAVMVYGIWTSEKWMGQA